MDSLMERQRLSWEQGQCFSIEALLTSVAPMEDEQVEREVVLNLICNELLLREERGERPLLEEYQGRFPSHADALRVQWELNLLMRDPTLDSLSGRSDESQHVGQRETIYEQRPQLLDSPRRGSPRYEVRRKIGQGAMGVVYEAWDSQLRRLVALKRLKSGMDASQEELNRMRAEAEAIARIRHSNIVQVFDVGSDGGMPYIAMEYCRGGTLGNRISGQPMETRRAAELVRQIALGISAAHRARMVHRDLKPNNILLSEAGGWEPKITDFGLAKLLDNDSSATATGSIIGTPAYMAPEQAFGDAKYAGPAADVYSIGAILYECLTGRPPFEANSIAETLDMVRNQVPTNIRRLRGSVPKDLETIAMVCLRKEPFQRYEDATALEEDLHRFLNGVAIKAKEESVGEMAWRIIRRFPVTTSLVALTAFLLLSITMGSIFLARHMNDLRLKAEQATAESDRKGQMAIDARNRARDALDSMTSGIASTFLREQQAISDEQKRFLRQVIAYYDELSAHSETSKSELRAAARAAYRVGSIYDRLGEKDLARQNYALAASRFRKLKDHVEKYENQSQWAMDVVEQASALTGQGYAYRDLGDLSKAEECYQEGVLALEEVEGKFQDDPRVLVALAWLHHNIAVIHYGRNDLVGRKEYLEKSYGTYSLISDRFPGYSGHHFEMAILEVSLAGVQSSHELACERFLSARQKLRELLHSRPTDPSYSVRLGWCLHTFAFHLLSSKDYVRSTFYVEEAIDVLGPLCERFPKDSGYQSELIAAITCNAKRMQAVGEFADAVKEYKRGVQIAEVLAEEHFESTVIQSQLCELYTDLALLLESSACHSEAVELCEKHLFACQRLKDWRQFSGKAFDPRLEQRLMLAATLASSLDDEREEEFGHIVEECCCRLFCREGEPWVLQRERSWILLRKVALKLNRHQYDEVIELVDRWTKSDEWGADAFYNFACCYSLVSGRLEESDPRKLAMGNLAMQFLQKAKDDGWTNWRMVQREEDFREIFDRQDFQKLVASPDSETQP